MLQALLNKLPGDKVRHGELVIDGEKIAVEMRRHGQARRLILRLSRDGRGLKVTVPPGTGFRRAMEFAASQGHWIREQLARRRVKAAGGAFQPGSPVPLRGIAHRIVHVDGRRGTVRCDAARRELLVAGDEPHIARRLTDWLKAEARRDLSAASQAYAGAMGVSYKRLSIRDTSSRWGSCSSAGALSYSWRLILAPAEVLDYVAAHEVAHLAEMNHGPAFWALVRLHCPQTDTARKWLKTHGAGLHGYGATDG